MRTPLRVWIGVLLSVSLAVAQAPVDETPRAKAGGVELAIPGPGGMPEAGDRLRTTAFELMVPSTNRLLTAYVPSDILALVSAGKPVPGLSHYAMVQVPRQAEYMDFTPELFEKTLESVEAQFAKMDSKAIAPFSEELNLRLKQLGTKPIEIQEPEILGRVFRKSGASGYAMLTPMKREDKALTMAGAFGYVLVKQRLMYAYLYRRYESSETVRQLGKELEAWVDAIAAANR